jgi:hypothetical protein
MDGQKGVTQELLGILILNFQEMIREMIKKDIFVCYHFYYNYHDYYYYYYHTTIYNIEREFELNLKTLCACTLSKERISRIDLGIKLELSEKAKTGISSDQKAICPHYY